MHLSQVPNHPNLASSWVQEDLTLLLKRPEKEKAANTEKVNSETTSNSHLKILLQRISPEQKVPDRIQTAQNHCRGAVTGSWALKYVCFASLLNSLLYPSSSPRGVLGGQKGSTVWRGWSQGKPSWRGSPQMPFPRMDQHHQAQSSSRAALFCQKNTVVPSSRFSPKKPLDIFHSRSVNREGRGKTGAGDHFCSHFCSPRCHGHRAQTGCLHISTGCHREQRRAEKRSGLVKSASTGQALTAASGWHRLCGANKVCTDHWGLLICVVRACPRAKAHS